MGHRWGGPLTPLAFAVMVLLLAPGPATGQAPPGMAKVWSPARTPDGQPDMQGHWGIVGGGIAFTENIEEGTDLKHAVHRDQGPPVQHGLIVDPSDKKIPYQPWAAAQAKEYYDHRHNPNLDNVDPVALCFLAGVPRVNYQSGLQILQPPGYVVFLYDFEHAYRIVPLDGRPHLGENIKLWLGDSRGHWEGNTLVVEITNDNGKTWFDWSGNFHTDALRIVERFSFVDANKIGYEATLEDAKAYTRPWKVAFNLARNRDEKFELLEDACFEGNRAPELMHLYEKTPKENR